MNNRKRLKKLILANKETRWLYRMMQFLAIFMVVSCLAIITLAKWIEYDQNKKREELFGSWDEVFLNVNQEDLNYFRKNAFLEQISVQFIQEKVFLEGDQRVVIGSCDGNFLEMGNIELLEGRMPKDEKEVAVEEEYLNVLGVSSVGDIVPDNSKVESLRGYKVIGVIENYSRYWKLVNRNIKFINCIICFAQNNEVQVLVKYNNFANKDPEINMIDYCDNIDDFHIDITQTLFGISFFYIAMIIIFLIMIGIKLKINFDQFRNENFITKFICSDLVSLIMNIGLSILITRIFTKAYFGTFHDYLWQNNQNYDFAQYFIINWSTLLSTNQAKINLFIYVDFILNEVTCFLLSFEIVYSIIGTEVLRLTKEEELNYNSVYFGKRSTLRRYYSKMRKSRNLTWLSSVSVLLILILLKYNLVNMKIILIFTILYVAISLLALKIINMIIFNLVSRHFKKKAIG